MNRQLICGVVTRVNENNGIKRMTVKCDRDITSSDGNVLSDYIEVVCFGDLAKDTDVAVDDHVKVIGRIQTGSYTNKDGQKVYTTDVAALSVAKVESAIPLNETILMGRLTRDPDVRTNENSVVARYTLAVDRMNSRNARENEQTADFIQCVAFGRSAEFAEKYLKQGTKMLVNGRIQTGSYTNKDGQKVYTTDVVINTQEFAESRAAAGSAANAAVIAPEEVKAPEMDEDEALPFN